VKYLISKGVDLDAKGSPDHLDLLNPLVVAYHRNHKTIVELLLNAGADPRKLDDYIKELNPLQKLYRTVQYNCTIL
jgi:hypothetical protein